MDQEKRAKRNSIIGLVIAVVGAVVWSLIWLGENREFHEKLRVGDYAYAAGLATADVLIITLVVWLVLYLAFLRRKVVGRGGAYFAILLISIVVVDGSLIALIRVAASRQSASNDAQMLIAIDELTRARTSLADPSGPPIDTHVRSTGEAAIVERLSKTHLAALRAAAIEYRTRVSSLGWPDFIEPKQLGINGRVSEARTKLVKARGMLAAYRTKMKAIIAKYHDDVAAAPLSDATKQGVIRGFEKSMRDGWPLRERELQIEDENYAEIEDMMRLLERWTGRWFVRNGKFVFTNQTDLDTWLAHTARLNKLDAEQASIETQIANFASQTGQ